MEVYLTTFLDTNIEFKDVFLEPSVYHNPTKLPIPWNSEKTKRKQNVTIGELDRSKQVSSSFRYERLKPNLKLLISQSFL